MSVDPTKLFAQSEVCLFGWLIDPGSGAQQSAEAQEKKRPPPPIISSKYLFQQEPGTRGVAKASDQNLLRTIYADGAWLASIHAFSCEGKYAQFRTPALFLVTGPGDEVWKPEGVLRPERFGLPHLDRTIYFASDLKFWTYERGAQIVRLDMSAGTVQRLVVDIESNAGQGRRIDLVGQESTFMGRLAPGN